MLTIIKNGTVRLKTDKKANFLGSIKGSINESNKSVAARELKKNKNLSMRLSFFIVVNLWL